MRLPMPASTSTSYALPSAPPISRPAKNEIESPTTSTVGADDRAASAARTAMTIPTAANTPNHVRRWRKRCRATPAPVTATGVSNDGIVEGLLALHRDRGGFGCVGLDRESHLQDA